MSRFVIPVALAALTLGGPAFAGKKDKKSAAAVEPAGPAPVAAPTTPDDAKSRAFGQKLVSLSITDFKPSDGGGASMLYSTLRFGADNRFTASAYVAVADERMECTESGPWAMDPAESDATATVALTVEKTDCPGRDAGSALRMRLTLGKSGVDEVQFR